MIRQAKADAVLLRQAFASCLKTVRPDVHRAAREIEFARRAESYQSALARLAESHETQQFDDVSIDGLKLRVPREEQQKSLANRLVGDRALPFEDIARALPWATGAAMIDIGANVGVTAIPRAVIGHFQTIYAVEPEPRNYAALVHNIVANGLRGLVLPDRAIIGSTTGTAWLQISRQIGGHHVRPFRPKWLTAEGPRDIEVPAYTFDTWVDRMAIDLTAVTFIKCDTQGWEGHVLRGATNVLRHKHIAWQLEVWPKGLSASGIALSEVLDQLASSFSHFRLLRGRGTDSKPTAKLPDEMDTVFRPPAAKAFCDILTFNA